MAGLVALIVLFSVMMLVGTAPSRRVEKVSNRSATLLCFRVRDQIHHDELVGTASDPETVVSYHDLCDGLLKSYEAP